MHTSIRRQFLSLLLSTFVGIWLITGTFSYFNAKQEVADLLDAQLAQTSDILLSLSAHQLKTPENLPSIKSANSSTPNLIFQVWVNENTLFLHSNNAPEKHLTSKLNDFDDVVINNATWRVLRTQKNESIFSTEVATKTNNLDTISNKLFNAHFIPMLIGVPLIALLLTLSIERSFRPIRKIAKYLSRRKTINFSPIDETEIPIEIRPITSEINQLFSQMKTAFDTERRFTSDAAHELRTPLAALKTHAEIALKAGNREEQRTALSKVVQGVNRATRLVEQLLTLARLDPDTGFNNIRRFDLFIAAEEVLSTQAILAIDKNIDISLVGTRGKFVAGNIDAIAVMMRNLIDNAIRYTPKDGEVEVSITRENDTITWTVSDSGPGIPEEERSKIFNRFYRSLGTKESGSGLGLSIVTRIIELHRIKIKLDTSRMGGLQIDVTFLAKDQD